MNEVNEASPANTVSDVERFVIWLANWWRGYTDDDMQMAILLMTGPFMPGQVVKMTKGQFKAWLAYSGKIYCYAI